MQSYSQLGQDLAVLEHFGDISGGYFVDIGANDGITLSNTYLLETQYAWNGICIEPQNETYNRLEKNRKCICVDKAAYSVSGLNLEFVEKYDWLLSGLKDHFDFEFFKEAPIKGIVSVQTSTLTDILDAHGAPNYINYLSIDTEGSEIAILKGIDFNKYRFGFISIEHAHRVKDRAEQRAILEANGYTFLKQADFDDYYIGPYNQPGL